MAGNIGFVTLASGLLAGLSVYIILRYRHRGDARIESLNEELEKLNEELEERVRKRTRQLEDAQLQLTHADRLASLGILSGGVAHEINNPLAGAMGFIELSMRCTKKGDSLHSYLEKSYEGLKRCRDIVDNLLRFSRRTKPIRTRVDIPILIDRTLSLINYQLGVDNIRVEKSYSEDTPPLLLDETSFGQVILNLVLNARDAMRINRKGGTLRIETGPPNGKEVVIRVIDTGIGMSPSVISHIFDPFFTTKDAGEGTGLGLPLSLRTVDNHGGRIDVQSKEGEGSTFTIVLPLDKVRYAKG